MGPSMTGARTSLPLWTEIMKAHYINRPAEPFTVPEGIVYRVVCEESGALSAASCDRVRREVFVDGTEPRAYCNKEMTLMDVMRGFDSFEGLDTDQRLDEDDG